MSKPIPQKKIALVLQGGGVRGAFTAGALDVLLEQGISFPYVIGTSAGGLNGVNFIARDIGRSKYVSTELMSDPKFVSFRNFLHHGSFFDFDYLFHTVPQTVLPFNQDAYDQSDVTFIVATTRMSDGQAQYFAKGEIDDFYSALAATASLPLISKPVRVDGGHYLDGGTAAAIPFRKALEDGYDKLFVIGTRSEGYRKSNPKKSSRFIAKLMYRRFPGFLSEYYVQGDRYNRDEEELLRLQKEGTVFYLRPDVPPDVKLVEKDKAKLIALYEQGREVMQRELPALRAFMEDGHE